MFEDGQNIFDGDLEAMYRAVQGIGVYSDWTVAPKSGMTVTVDVGVGYIGTAKKETGEETDLVVTTADPYNPRRDIIIWDASATALAILAGTPDEIYPEEAVGYPLKMQAPAPPNLDTDDILVAEIYVAAGATEITSNVIFDKRHLMANPKTTYGYASLDASSLLVEAAKKLNYVSQAEEPTATVGEVIIWHDSEGPAWYFIFGTSGGNKKVALT